MPWATGGFIRCTALTCWQRQKGLQMGDFETTPTLMLAKMRDRINALEADRSIMLDALKEIAHPFSGKVRYPMARAQRFAKEAIKKATQADNEIKFGRTYKYEAGLCQQFGTTQRCFDCLHILETTGRCPK